MTEAKESDGTEMDSITQKLLDEEERTKQYEERVREELEIEESKIREKMAMNDASRFIQRKWAWWKVIGKTWAKKKKKKGGKKKKKK